MFCTSYFGLNSNFTTSSCYVTVCKTFNFNGKRIIYETKWLIISLICLFATKSRKVVCFNRTPFCIDGFSFYLFSLHSLSQIVVLSISLHIETTNRRTFLSMITELYNHWLLYTIRYTGLIKCKECLHIKSIASLIQNLIKSFDTKLTCIYKYY